MLVRTSVINCDHVIRKVKPKAVSTMIRMLRKGKLFDPIVVDEDMRLMHGLTRLTAYKKMRYEFIWVKCRPRHSEPL